MPSVFISVATNVPSTFSPVLATAVQEFASVPTAASTPQLFLLVDDYIPPNDGGLSPRKRRSVDARGEIPIFIDFGGGDFILQETVVIHVRESIVMDYQAPQLEEMTVNAPVCPEADTIEDGALDYGLSLLR